MEFRNGSRHIYKEDKLIVQTQPGSSLYNIIEKPSKEMDNYASLALTDDSAI